MRSTLFFAAFSSEPRRTMSQKVSPGTAWVTMATVICSVSATWPSAASPSPPAVSRPPVEEHAVRINRGIARNAMSLPKKDREDMELLLRVKPRLVAAANWETSSDRRHHHLQSSSGDSGHHGEA